MPSGGHARSGPAPTPGSGASERKGLKLKSLPAEGYRGEIPSLPFPTRSKVILRWWEWAWRTPQASLWVTPQWSWVVPAVADWCRLKARAEMPQCPMSVWAAIRQRESDILFSNDALIRAGYQVVVDELSEKRDEAKRPSSRDRLLRAVGDGG